MPREDQKSLKNRALTWTTQEDKAIVKYLDRYNDGKKKDWMGLTNYLKGRNLLGANKDNIDVKNRYVDKCVKILKYALQMEQFGTKTKCGQTR